MARKMIDVERAKTLRGVGLTYRRIGEVIARKQGRWPPYTARGVIQALARAAKETQK